MWIVLQATAQFQNHIWSMDFMHDNLYDCRKYRTLNIIDDYNREALATEIDFSLPAARVIRTLCRLIEQRGKPFAIRCDNGPEYISNNLKQWIWMYNNVRPHMANGGVPPVFKK